METDDPAQGMQSALPEVAPASPPPPINRFCLGCLTPNARVRTLGSDCAVWQAAGAAGAAATVLDTPSATAQLPALQVSPLYTAPTRAQRNRHTRFSTQPRPLILRSAGRPSVPYELNPPPPPSAYYAPFTPLDEKAREPEVCRTSSRLRAILCRPQCWNRLMTDISALSAAQGGSSLRVRVSRGR